MVSEQDDAGGMRGIHRCNLTPVKARERNTSLLTSDELIDRFASLTQNITFGSSTRIGRVASAAACADVSRLCVSCCLLPLVQLCSLYIRHV